MSDSIPSQQPGAVGSTGKLFIRRSSGLVRSVSVTNAMFFNVAALTGAGVTLLPLFMALPGVPLWTWGPFSSFAWAAVICFPFLILLAFIFASLTSVMPRSGGDYVFTSRIVHPLLGWLESWSLVLVSVAIIALEVPLVLRSFQIEARIIGIGIGNDTLSGANSWFTDSTGSVTGSPGFLAGLVVVALIGLVALLPTRLFHKVVTWLSIIGLSAFVLSMIFVLGATSRGDFEHNLPSYTNGVTAAQIANSGKAFSPGATHHFFSDIFSTQIFVFVLAIMLFNYIGFQYSAYIAGEVRGNVRRGVLVALIGALVICLFCQSVYVTLMANHFGSDMNVSWASAFWGYNTNLSALPLGQPNAIPLLAVVANKDLWPIWAFINLAGTIFPFLICPVYINFISRMQLAWSLDRQVPEWFGRVNERFAAPVNATIATLALVVVFLFFASYNALPHLFATTGNKLNLAGTAWFAVVMSALTWLMPGVNAICLKWRRKDLIRNAPFRKALPWLGLAWLVFPAWIYWFAVIKPIWNSLTAQGAERLTYLETNGIMDALVFVVLGLIIYFVMRARNRSEGVDLDMMFTEIPPD